MKTFCRSSFSTNCTDCTIAIKWPFKEIEIFVSLVRRESSFPFFVGTLRRTSIEVFDRGRTDGHSNVADSILRNSRAFLLAAAALDCVPDLVISGDVSSVRRPGTTEKGDRFANAVPAKTAAKMVRRVVRFCTLLDYLYQGGGTISIPAVMAYFGKVLQISAESLIAHVDSMNREFCPDSPHGNFPSHIFENL